MRKWTSRLMTIVGVVLILVAAYLSAKPHIDNYLHDKDKDGKIEQYDKNVEEQASRDNKQQAKPQVPKDKSEVAGYIEIPDADIREPIYPEPATPEQLNRDVSFAEENKSLGDQNISIAGHTFIDRPNYQFTDLKAAKEGSMVYFKVGNETYKCKTASVRDVKPTDIEALDEQKGKDKQLTLITCDNYNKKTGIWEKRKIFVATEVK